MEYYNITALNNELTKLENTKNNIKNSLMNKGQNIADDRPFSNYVQNIDALGTVHQFNTKAEMDVTTNLPKGTLGIVYSEYKYSKVDTIFIDNIYLPKKLSYTYNEISNLGNNYILGELEVDENTLYARASVYDDGSETFITVSVNGTMYNYVWENNVWTRLDADKGYIQISISNNLVYRTYNELVREILEYKDKLYLNGIYQWRNQWNLMPLGDNNVAKIYDTIEEMQQDPNPQEGDLALVYSNQQSNMAENSVFSKITLPETVVLDMAVSDYIDIGFIPVDDSNEMDCWGYLNQERMDCSIYIMGEETDYRISYTSSDGITYIRSNDTPEEIDFGFDVKFGNRWGEAQWDDRIGQFFIVGQVNFGGLFNYANNSYQIAPTQLSTKPEYVYKGYFYGENGVESRYVNEYW